jgi:manganese oxidase
MNRSRSLVLFLRLSYLVVCCVLVLAFQKTALAQEAPSVTSAEPNPAATTTTATTSTDTQAAPNAGQESNSALPPICPENANCQVEPLPTPIPLPSPLPTPTPGPTPPPPTAPSCARTITANVVAFDIVYFYNRFGAFNPAGMMYALKRDVIGNTPGNVQLRPGKRPRPIALRVNEGDCLEVAFTNLLSPTRPNNNSTFTRTASMHVNGMDYVRDVDLDDGANVGRNESSLAAPGETRTYKWYAAKQGQYLMYSMGAPDGGEGDGGQPVLGLFGSINVEPKNARWYRSQVTAAQLQAATTGTNPNGTPIINYEATYSDGTPVLNILKGNEIVHSDLNAVITGFTEDCADAPPSSTCGQSFREFTVVFHDEAKVVQAFPELDQELFHGVRDGFPINYGSGGLGAIVLANRKRVGPSKNCNECKFEEFFLESHPNGDPALIVRKDAQGNAVEALFPDDPSNVHHSYLNDPVRFRNTHAGPKETHVFHLHAHQWLQSPRDQNSTYLDSQTISPGASYTYEINYGGSGNRNITPGDAIFHCHLYPHFAQGMWELWRNHDVFEAGTPDRNLPDAEIAGGVPNPAIVPIPDRPMPPMPTATFRGYPFYIAGEPGHRPPQPPYDLEFDGGLPRHEVKEAEIVDGQAAVPPALLNDPVAARVLSQNNDPFLLFFARKLIKAKLELLPPNGTPAEVQAIRFHQGLGANPQDVPGVPTTTRYQWPAVGYPSFTSAGTPGLFLVNGQPPKPGAPYADPCHPAAPLRPYRGAYIQFDMTVNKYGWHDRQARITTLEADAIATLGGARKAEPLYFRANSGDCVTFASTNLIPNVLNLDDFQIFTPTDIIGQHIHLVKFDVTSSDGAGNGWNYEDGSFSPDEVRERIAANNAWQQANNGSQILTAREHPVFGAGHNNQFVGAQTTIQRWWADPLLNNAGQDRTIRTVFTHDHFGPSSHQHHGLYAALVVEPTGSQWTTLDGQQMGTRYDGGPTSFAANIVTGPAAAPDQGRSYREFNLAFADFAIVYTKDLKPVNPPGFMEAPLPIAVEQPPIPMPESISAGDPGTQLINYRNEPIPHRIGQKDANGEFIRDTNGFVLQKTGPQGDMANVFSTRVHGQDPGTPVLTALETDRVQVRLIQGAQEEQHVFNVHGHKWLFEPSVPNSGFRNGQQIGISEHFEFEVNPMPQTPVLNVEGVGTNVRDHLYSSAATDNLWDGQWGIFRTFHSTPTSPAQGTFIDLDGTRRALAPLPKPVVSSTTTEPISSVCPAGAPARAYNVSAVLVRDVVPDGKLIYNRTFNIADPNAIMFVQDHDIPALQGSGVKPEPLILRAAAGDCITVTLTNRLPNVVPEADSWNEVPPIVNKFNFNQIKTSNRVGLHPQLVAYDPATSDGANVGLNPDTTVGPGQSITYTWYAGGQLDNIPGDRSRVPIEFGATNLRDMGDVIKHSSHGAIGALIIEPQGSTWMDAYSIPNPSKAQANIFGANNQLLFREFVVLYQDDLSVQQNGVPLQNVGGEDDSEDTGFKAFNYRSEPIWARLGLQVTDVPDGVNDKDLTNVLSSRGYRDPETPVFTATAGTQVRFRVLDPAGHPRQHGFTIFGHNWQFEPWQANSTVQGNNPFTFLVGSDSGIGPTRHSNILTQAGGRFALPGDYLYRTQESFQFTNGLWGIFRVQ